MPLSHINERGEASMVDVGSKPVTARRAKARATVAMKEETLALIFSGSLPKGDALGTARLAGIMAAKKTAELIPLCHTVPLDHVEVLFRQNGPGELVIEAAAACGAKTGVEMEALTAVSVAALTVYDMCKAVDRGIIIGEIKLLKKTGGKSGTFTAGAETGENDA